MTAADVQTLDIQFSKDLAQYWGWFLLWGVLLLAIGIAAVWRSMSATLASMLFFGWLLAFAAVIARRARRRERNSARRARHEQARPTGRPPPSVPRSIEGHQADRRQRRRQRRDGDDHAQPQEIPGGDMMPFPP